MTDYTMWAVPPWEPTAHSDAPSSSRTANAFYATTQTWWCTGAQLRAPADSGLGTVTLSLRLALNGVLPDLSSAPVASGQVVVGSAAGWYDVNWSGVEVLAPDAMWICLETATGTGYLFVGEGTVGPNFVQADGGISLYLAEQDHPRGAYREGAAGTTVSRRHWYGVVPKVSNVAPVPPETLPTTGTLEPVAIPVHDIVPTTPERDLVSLTPARTLEIP